MKQFAFIITAVLSLLATGCIYDRDDICPGPDENRENAFVNLCISVAATNSFAPGSTQSRADGEEEDNNKYFFEKGIAPYEEINSLRVIMVNSEDNKVEYNEFIKGADGTSTNKVDQITLRTTPGGKRRLWLVANEASLAGHLSTDIDFKTIKRGDELKTEEMALITLSSESAGAPLFSNGSTYIPMTEFFDVDISKIPEDWSDDLGPFSQHASIFVTRAAVKFSFIFQEKAPFSIGKHYRISNIKIHSTGTSEYLFPNNTTYSPLKSLSTDDREITAFDSPADNKVGDAVFEITEQDYNKSENYSTISEEDEKYGILNEGDRVFTFAPTLYFPETKLANGCTMDVTVKWLDNEEPTTETYEDFPLLNLPYGGLPRNTHVLVIISAGEHDLEATVKLVPYIGVTLDPVFGFEDLVPGKKNNQDSPENTNIPEN